MNMCDRILVMRNGRVAGEVHPEEFSEERIIALATGAKEAA
jgi:ribose transport system ATP-binding protein